MKLVIEVGVSSCDECPMQRYWKEQGASWYYCGLKGLDSGKLQLDDEDIPSWCPAKEKNT